MKSKQHLVSLKQHLCFSEPNRLEKLNKAIKLHQKLLMPHVIAAQTGCTIQDCTALLLELSFINFADAKLLVYVKNNPETPIMKRAFLDGFPPLPIEETDEHDVITTLDELLFDLAFELKFDDIEFVVENEI